MSRLASLLFMAALASFTARAEELISGAGFAVDTTEVESELAFRPPGIAMQTAGNEGALRALIDDLYRREAVVAAAEKAGLLDDPKVRYRLERARKEALLAAMLDHQAETAREQPNDFAALAEEHYRANREQYRYDEQVDVSHILLRADTAQAKTERHAEAEAILARLKTGEDFATLAERLSEDPGSGKRGGNLGFFGRGRMVPEFEQAAFALKKPGDLSGLVETNFGWHILKLNQRREAADRPFEEVRASIIDTLKQQYVKDQVRAWFEDVTSFDQATIHREAIDAFVSATVAKAAQPVTP